MSSDWPVPHTSKLRASFCHYKLNSANCYNGATVTLNGSFFLICSFDITSTLGVSLSWVNCLKFYCLEALLGFAHSSIATLFAPFSLSAQKLLILELTLITFTTDIVALRDYGSLMTWCHVCTTLVNSLREDSDWPVLLKFRFWQTVYVDF